MVPKRIPIELGGASGYCSFRNRGVYAVDKTLFIQHVLESSHASMLIPRPRRFGKTFNMTTLKDFFELPESPKRAEWVRRGFEGSQIWDVPSAREHFQKYPVISLTFKSCKGLTWASAWNYIRFELLSLLGRHHEVYETPGILNDFDRSWYEAAMQRALSEDEYSHVVRILSQGLERLHGMPVLILIDEYDTPIHNALERGFYTDAISFFKPFFNNSFKDNSALFRGVITGILRVSKENMFSDLNHLGVFTLLKDEFKTDFGLTQEEVIHILEDQGCPELLPGIERMYNGYLFGTDPPVAIYNPWSTLSCIAATRHELYPYWNKSGSPELLHSLIVKNGPSIHAKLQMLLEHQTVQVTVTDDVVLTALEQSPSDLFSFMLFTGYLKATQVQADGQNWNVTLGLVNQELKQILTELYRNFLARGQADQSPEPFLRAVLGGDAEALRAELATILRHNTSYLDGATRKPENFYQGLMLGLLMLLKHEYQVISNLESGMGRADLLLIPRAPGKVGVTMELKVVPENGSLVASLLAGLEQIEARQYTARLEEAHATPIHAYAVAFDGKVVRVATPAQRESLLKEQQTLTLAPPAPVAAPVAAPAPKRTGKAAKAPQTPPPFELEMEDRLALQQVISSLVDRAGMEQLWILLGQPFHELPDRVVSIGFGELLNRCEAQGKLTALVKVLGHTFPVLKTEPLLVRLQEQLKR